MKKTSLVYALAMFGLIASTTPLAAQQPTLEETETWIQANIFKHACDDVVFASETKDVRSAAGGYNSLYSNGLKKYDSRLLLGNSFLELSYRHDAFSQRWSEWQRKTAEWDTDITLVQRIDDLEKIDGYSEVTKVLDCYLFEIHTDGNYITKELSVDYGSTSETRSSMRIVMANKEMAERMKTAFKHWVELSKQALIAKRNAEPF